MAYRILGAGTPVLLLRAQSRMLRLRKHSSYGNPLSYYLLLLAFLLLLAPNLLLFVPSTAPLLSLPLSPVPHRRLQPGAGGSPNYRLTPLQEDVRNVTRTMFRAYMETCMGRDEFEPTTGHCHDWFNVGLTILDSLDTLILMDLEPEYQQCREWAEAQLSFKNVEKKVSLFEIVIRAMGGLNSAYQLTNDKLWLNKSAELGDMLLQSFGINKLICPPPTVFIGDDIKARIQAGSVSSMTTPAEAGTLQLEFRTLSQMTGDPKYARAVDPCQQKLVSAMPSSGLVTSYYDIQNNEYFGTRLCIGGGVDSFYEMLVKNWITWGKADITLRDAYQVAVEAIYKTLARNENGHVFIGEMASSSPETMRPAMDHLACFFPGTLAIAAQHGLGGGLYGEDEDDYMPRARALTESCFAMTRGTRSGLAGEITDFQSKIPRPQAGQDMSYLRPEIVEALYYMDKLDPKAGDRYKKMGRIMWMDMRRSAQVIDRPDGIMSSTFDLLFSRDKTSHHDKLHSFVIAETFKYFYLLFDERPPLEGPFPLDKWVYNTEAHPIRIVERR